LENARDVLSVRDVATRSRLLRDDAAAHRRAAREFASGAKAVQYAFSGTSRSDAEDRAEMAARAAIRRCSAESAAEAD
jgi:hypothetical protein